MPSCYALGVFYVVQAAEMIMDVEPPEKETLAEQESACWTRQSLRKMNQKLWIAAALALVIGHGLVGAGARVALALGNNSDNMLLQVEATLLWMVATMFVGMTYHWLRAINAPDQQEKTREWGMFLRFAVPISTLAMIILVWEIIVARVEFVNSLG